MNLLNEVKYFVPRYLDTLGLDDKVTFGLEIEFEDLLLDIAQDEIFKLPVDEGWNVVLEQTVDPFQGHSTFIHGGECNSPICMDEIDEVTTWKELKIVCDKLKELGAHCGELSGGHIHIGAQIFEANKNYLANFLKLWMIYENVIYQMGYAGKGPRSVIDDNAKKMNYLLKDVIWDIDDMDDYYALVTKLTRIFSDGAHGINFNKMKYDTFLLDNTMEFRYPNGSLIPFVWQNNVNFITKLINYAKSNDFDNDFINFRIVNDNLLSYNNVALELANLIFNSDREKLYFLYQYLGYCNSERNALVKTRKSMK